MISIPEKVFLLSLYEKRNGSIQTCRSPFLPYGLIAGGLMELVFSGAGEINTSRKVVISDSGKEGHSIPADLLRQILFEKDYKKCSFWIEALGHKRKKIEEEFIRIFIEKKILAMDGQVYHFSPEPDAAPEKKFLVKEEIRQQFLGGQVLSPENFMVLKIMNSIHLLDQIFTYDEIKPIHVQIDQLKYFNSQKEDGEQVITGIPVILDSLNQIISGVRD